MYKQNNVFDKLAGLCAKGILLSFPLIIVGAATKSIILMISLMLFFFSFGLSFIFQNLADGIRHNIKKTMYVVSIPCEITNYTIEGATSTLEKPVLTPIYHQYDPFSIDTYLDMKTYPIYSKVEVRFTPDMNFEDCFIATKENLNFDKSIRIVGIIMIIIGILIPFIYNLFS